MALVLPDYRDRFSVFGLFLHEYSRHMVSSNTNARAVVTPPRLPRVLVRGQNLCWNWGYLNSSGGPAKSPLRALAPTADLLQFHVSKPPRTPAPSNFNAAPSAHLVVGLDCPDCLGCPIGSRYVPPDPASLQLYVSPNTGCPPPRPPGRAPGCWRGSACTR